MAPLEAKGTHFSGVSGLIGKPIVKPAWFGSKLVFGDAQRPKGAKVEDNQTVYKGAKNQHLLK